MDDRSCRHLQPCTSSSAGRGFCGCQNSHLKQKNKLHLNSVRTRVQHDDHRYVTTRWAMRPIVFNQNVDLDAHSPETQDIHVHCTPTTVNNLTVNICSALVSLILISQSKATERRLGPKVPSGRREDHSDGTDP